MKILIAAIMFILSLNAQAYNCFNRGYFTVVAECQVNPTTARCSIQNYCNKPMYCTLQGNAYTRSGFSGFISVQSTVYPHSYMYGYVNANNPYYDPLVFAQAQASCYF